MPIKALSFSKHCLQSVRGTPFLEILCGPIFFAPVFSPKKNILKRT